MHFFRGEWIHNLTQFSRHRRYRETVCSKIKKIKERTYLQRIQDQQTATTICKTLKILKSKQNTNPIVQEANFLNDIF